MALKGFLYTCTLFSYFLSSLIVCIYGVKGVICFVSFMFRVSTCNVRSSRQAYVSSVSRIMCDQATSVRAGFSLFGECRFFFSAYRYIGGFRILFLRFSLSLALFSFVGGASHLEYGSFFSSHGSRFFLYDNLGIRLELVSSRYFYRVNSRL